MRLRTFVERVGLIRLAGVVLPGCLDFKGVPWQDDSLYWECFGECEVCTEMDASGTCSVWEVRSANPTMDPSGPAIAKTVCAFSDDAEAACITDFEQNLVAATDVYAIRNCRTITAPVEDASTQCCVESADCDGEEGTGDDVSSPSALPVSLSADFLRIDPASSTVAVTWRGSSVTKSLDGWAQFRQDPFRMTMLYADAPTATLGGISYETPYVLTRHDVPAMLADNGAITITMAAAEVVFGYKASGYREQYRARALFNVVGSLNYGNNAGSAGGAGAVGPESVTITLSGAYRRTPIPAFTLGSISNCAVSANASGSSDPDGGSIQGYYWRVNGRPVKTGVTPSIPVKQGTNVIELRVRDNENVFSPRSRSRAVTVSANPPC